MVNQAICGLLNYGIKENLLSSQDVNYVANRILRLLGLDDFSYDDPMEISLALDYLMQFALNKGLCEATLESKEIFKMSLLDEIVPLPSVINKQFNDLFRVSPKKATDYFYDLSIKSGYIHLLDIKKNIYYEANCNHDKLEITINLSKPEKDPKDIARVKDLSFNYPKCLLCKENEGYLGRLGYPARSNHRIISLVLNNENWFLQYSPYAYYEEHCIVFKDTHEPMKITKDTFARLLEFVEKFPHYFLGSNADLPIVGGSILSHDHFQGGKHHFAIERAKNIYSTHIQGFSSGLSIIDWPMSVIRLEGEDKKDILELANYIFEKWKSYSDQEAGIFSFTSDEHNTVTPIARRNNGLFQLDIVLRNNRTTKEHPLGLFHPHANLHHIKKENIGLIEVMGLAILPPRLEVEIENIKRFILNKDDCDVSKHLDWISKLVNQYNFTKDNIDEILKLEIAKTFYQCLEDAGVFKNSEEGFKHFKMFVDSL